MRLGSFTERNKSAMAYRTHSLQSSVPSIQWSNTLKSPDHSTEAVSYSRDLQVKGPPSLEKGKQQQARRGLLHSDRPVDSAEASSEANYLRYLKEKGYGDASLQEVKEQQAKLGLFQADRVPIKRPDNSFDVSSEASYIRYLTKKGYGLVSLEEVKYLQAKLGLFHSSPVSYGNKASRSGRLEGEQGPNDLEETSQKEV